jgi:hypothetical protein
LCPINLSSTCATCPSNPISSYLAECDLLVITEVIIHLSVITFVRVFRLAAHK